MLEFTWQIPAGNFCTISINPSNTTFPANNVCMVHLSVIMSLTILQFADVRHLTPMGHQNNISIAGIDIYLKQCAISASNTYYWQSYAGTNCRTHRPRLIQTDQYRSNICSICLPLTIVHITRAERFVLRGLTFYEFQFKHGICICWTRNM